MTAPSIPRRVAVTGGAGGIGAALAAGLTGRGHSVAALDLRGARLQESAARTGAAAVECDLTDETSVERAFAAVEGALGGLDAVVLAAGVQLHSQDGPAMEVTLDTWQHTLAVNLTGAFLTVKHALPHLVRNNFSSIVLIGSPTGLTMEGAGNTAYAASKAGMMALGRVVAADYAGDGVRANVVVPGPVDTPLIAELIADPESLRNLEARTPLGRLGRPEELTGLIAWLISPEAEFATGAFFAVDGGMTAR